MGRALFYLDSLTVGFTYYEGILHYDANENLVLYRDPSNSNILRLNGQSELSSIRSYGVELAIPMGKWVPKLDAVYFSSTEDLDIGIKDYNNQKLGYSSMDNFSG